MAHLRNGFGERACVVSTGKGGASIHPEKEWLPGARRSAVRVCLHHFPQVTQLRFPAASLVDFTESPSGTWQET